MSRSDKSIQTKNRLEGCQAQGEGNQWGVNANGFGVSYWDNKNVLALDSGDNYTTLVSVLNATVHLKWLKW